MFSFVTVALLLLTSAAAYADEPVYPEYIRNARSQVDKAEAKSAELNSYTDEVLIARNYLKNSEAEYKKHLGWSGKLDEKGEPTVRYFASMAEIQASIVLARAGKVSQDKERASLEQQLVEVKSKIKIFDDKNDEIAGIKKGLTELNAALMALKDEKEQLVAKTAAQDSDISAKATAMATAERRVATLSTELASCMKSQTQLEQAQNEISKLKAELTAKRVAESQSKEQIGALNRQKDFAVEVGKLGGVIKGDSDNLTVIFGRSSMLKSPKNDTLTADGGKALDRIADLLKGYPEYRVKLKVHGFGQPTKNEDASATDRMARLIREALLEKGKFDPATVEALGAGSAEPIYPKANIEGNRRLEVTFVKR